MKKLNILKIYLNIFNTKRHSLGAHIAGYVGMFVTKSNGKIGRITGLDPAMPGYMSKTDPNKKLDKSDGKYIIDI